MKVESDLALTGFQGLGVIGFTVAVRTGKFCFNQSQNILPTLVGIDFMMINICSSAL